jgi:hypothetical protein
VAHSPALGFGADGMTNAVVAGGYRIAGGHGGASFLGGGGRAGLGAGIDGAAFGSGGGGAYGDGGSSLGGNGAPGAVIVRG